jgi:hypothetical protein
MLMMNILMAKNTKIDPLVNNPFFCTDDFRTLKPQSKTYLQQHRGLSTSAQMYL